MNAIVLFSTMLKLFALILVGYILGKTKKVNEIQNQTLSYLAAHVFGPGLVIASIYSNGTVTKDPIVTEALIVGVILYIFLFIFTNVIFKFIKAKDDNIYKMSFIFYNTGFIGYPIMQALYGDYAIFLFAILHMGYNFFIFSYGVMLIQGKSSFNIKDMLTPGFLSSVLALLLYFTQIQLPTPIVEFCSLLGNGTIPTSMIVIGVSLSFVPIRDVIQNYLMIGMVILKLIGMPILFYFVVKFIPVSSMMKEMLMISATLPAGSMIVILSNQYKGNGKLAASLVFVSTLLSIFTIPLMLNILI